MPGLGPGIHEFAEEKAHPATQDRALFFRDLCVCACELVDARPKAWHDERGADGAKPLLRRHHLTPMGSSPAMTIGWCDPTGSRVNSPGSAAGSGRACP